ncbi:MAG: hypothetical protein ACJ748_17445 [Flavisolibacter sp.]
MKNYLKINRLFIALLFSFGLLSCHHDKPLVPKYRVSKANYYSGSGTLEETGTFSYSNGNQISRIDFTGDKNYYYTFEYSAGKISKRNEFWFPGSTTADAYESISYNGDGTTSSIDYYEKDGSSYSKMERTDFTYVNGKISKITETWVNNNTNDLQQQYDYTYANGNISTVTSTDYNTTPADVETVNFTFDSNKNYFNSVFLQPFITDDSFYPVDESTMSVLLSTNNVSSEKVGNVTTPVSYTLDDHNNLTKVSVSGFQILGYEYSTY